VQKTPQAFFAIEDFVPDLRARFNDCPPDPKKLEAILARLERSCRTFELGPTSCNYVASIRMVLKRTSH
jgi:hypothetical protein